LNQPIPLSLSDNNRRVFTAIFIFFNSKQARYKDISLGAKSKEQRIKSQEPRFFMPKANSQQPIANS